MSRPLIQNFILTFGFIAFVVGAVRVAVAFPATMHNVGVLVPHTAEEAVFESLEACGQ